MCDPALLICLLRAGASLSAQSCTTASLTFSAPQSRHVPFNLKSLPTSCSFCLQCSSQPWSRLFQLIRSSQPQRVVFRDSFPNLPSPTHHTSGQVTYISVSLILIYILLYNILLYYEDRDKKMPLYFILHLQNFFHMIYYGERKLKRHGMPRSSYIDI